jgi:chromosome segregation ATPase
MVVNDFSRLRSLVELMPAEDSDRQDLLQLLDLEEQHRRSIKHLQEDIFELLRQEDSFRKQLLEKDTELDSLGEAHRQLSGALELIRYMVKILKRKIEEQKISLGWLSRRLGKQKLQPYEKDELDNIREELRWENESVTNSTSPQT